MYLRTCLTCFILAGSYIAAPLTAQDQPTAPDVTITNIGIRVSTLPVDEQGQPLPMTVLASLPGTDLALFVRSNLPVREIIPQACRLRRAIDDMGKDLSTAELANDLHQRPLARQTTQTQDQLHTVIDWHVPGIPSPGSRGITIEGDLALRVGGKSQTITMEFATKNGSNSDWQQTTWTVSDVTTSDWEEGFNELTLLRSGPRLVVQRMEIVNNKGEPIENATIITNPNNPHEAPTIAYPGYLQSIRVEMDVIQGSAVLTVPIAIDTGLGIQEIPGRSAGNQL